MSWNEDDILKSSENMPTSEQSMPPHEETGWKDGWVPLKPAVGRRTLTFPDDTQVGLKGLDDIMAELYAEDMKPTDETAEEIITRLEEKKTISPIPNMYVESTRMPCWGNTESTLKIDPAVVGESVRSGVWQTLMKLCLPLL
jgi:hypothetical protein